MTNTPSLYNFKGLNIRVVQIDDAPWFVAADVLYALGFSQNKHGHATKALPTSERTLYQIQKGVRSQTLVSEAGLYKLVMRSDRPEAKAFKDWVTGTVLPAIRKDGGYIKGEEKVATGEMDEEEFILKAYDMLRRKVDRLAAERDAQRQARGEAQNIPPQNSVTPR